METDEKNNKTQIYNLIILDKSGSMHSIANAAIDGLNETMNGIRVAQEKHAETQQHYVTLHVFCGCEQKDVYDRKPIESVKELTRKDYRPCCNTPLYDAIGFSLNKIKETVKDLEDYAVAVTIITDGYENSSKEFDGPSIAQLIKELREKGWAFSYMGADHDVEQVALTLNIHNVVQFEHTSEGTGASCERDRLSRNRWYDRVEMCKSADDKEKVMRQLDLEYLIKEEERAEALEQEKKDRRAFWKK